MISSTQVERSSSQWPGPRTIACVPSGTATSNERPWLGPRNDGGVTPTIVNGVRSSVRVCPMTLASPPNRRCQKA
jgi:hypothetical protein